MLLMKKNNIPADIEKLSFEQALEQLDQIVSKLEDGSAKLEESIDEYTRGIQLKKQCEAKLKEATMKVEQISIDKDGKISKKDFVRE